MAFDTRPLLGGAAAFAMSFANAFIEGLPVLNFAAIFCASRAIPDLLSPHLSGVTHKIVA
jgi:hypothetical protein